MGISYVYNNPALTGEPCPICSRKSWNIFRCNDCGTVFCQYCHPKAVIKDKETGDISVRCPKCKQVTTFYDF